MKESKFCSFNDILVLEEGVEHEDEGGDLEQQPGPETQESVQSEKTKEYLVDIAAEVKHEPLVQKEESLIEQVSETVLEAEVVESKPEVDLNESKPEAEIVESKSVAEIVEPESEAEKTESNPEAEIVESKSETDVNESKPEAEVIESTLKAEIDESKPEIEVVESKSDTEIIEPNPAATSETSTPEVESKSDKSESTPKSDSESKPKAGMTKTKVEPTAKGGRTAAAGRTKPGATVPSRTGKDLDKTKPGERIKVRNEILKILIFEKGEGTEKGFYSALFVVLSFIHYVKTAEKNHRFPL